MQESPISLLDREQALLYTAASTVEEFVAAALSRELLAVRRREVRLPADAQLVFLTYPDTLHWLVVVADDSPDTVAVLPVLAAIAALCVQIDLRVLHDDEAAAFLVALMHDPDAARLPAEADLPLLLIFDEEWHLLEQWGPHPQAIEPYLDAWLAEHPDFERLAEDDSPAGMAAYQAHLDLLTQEMRCWYNSALATALVTELRELHERLHAAREDDSGPESPSTESDDEDEGLAA